MKVEQFCFWLKGFLEGKATLDKTEVEAIRKELNSVFQHDIDPSLSPDPKIQQALNNIHQGKPPFKPNNSGTGSTAIRC